MQIGLDVALLLAVLGVLGWRALKSVRRAARHDEVPAVAAAKGLEYAAADSFGSLGVAFPLFREGDGRQIENVMWRDGDLADEHAAPTHVFDYGFYRVHRDRYGRETQSWHWFTCALAQPNGSFPTLRVVDKTVVGDVLDHLEGEPITYESEEFNQTFRVTCDDRRFASAFIDPRMMELLLETKGAVGVETMGRFVLLVSHQVPPDEMPILLGLADELVERIPGAVWELYPKTAPAADAETAPPPSPLPPPASLDDRDPDAWDPTPGVDYDLDGHPVAPAAHEDPWHDRPLPPH